MSTASTCPFPDVRSRPEPPESAPDDLDGCARRAAEAFVAANRAVTPSRRAEFLTRAYRLQEKVERLRLRLRRSARA